MSDKVVNTMKDPIKKPTSEIVILIEKKILFFQDVIQKTILHVQKNKRRKPLYKIPKVKKQKLLSRLKILELYFP